MFLRQLSRLSSMLEGLAPPTHCIYVPSFYHVSSVDAAEENDSEGQRFQSFPPLPEEEIISTLEAKEDSITGSHIISALDNLAMGLKKFPRSEQRARVIAKLAPFLARNKSKLSGQEIVDVIKMLDQIRVRKSSKIYLEMLQCILNCSDDLSLENCCEISKIIQSEKIDYSLRHDLEEEIEKTFLNKLAKDFDEKDFDDSRKPFNWDEILPLGRALSLYASLHSLEHSELKFKALRKVQEDIAEQAHMLTENQIKGVVDPLPTQRNHDVVNEYFDEKLANKLARIVMDGNFIPGFAVLVLSRLNKSRLKYPELIEYCSAAVFSLSTRQSFNWKKNLLPELAVARERTVYWEEIQEFVLKHTRDLCQTSDSHIYMASRLISLNWLSNPFVEILFDGSFLPSNINNKSRIFCTIYQRLKLDPHYHGPMPTNAQIDALKLLLRKSHFDRRSRLFPLLSYLQDGMEDLACIQTDVKTRLFHEIDYVVAFHQDGTPAPISLESFKTDVKYIEDFTIPPGAKLIIILSLLESWFFRNTHELKGDYHTIVDTFRLLPYPVVCIDNSVLLKLPESEKSSFIMNEIRAKLNCDQ